MSKLYVIGWVALSYLVTGYELRDSGLRVHVCWLIRFRVPYEAIAFCDIFTVHRDYSIMSQSFKETVKRVFVRKASGFAVVLRVDDAEAFVSRLRAYAPQVQVRKLKEINRSFALGRRTS